MDEGSFDRSNGSQVHDSADVPNIVKGHGRVFDDLITIPTCKSISCVGTSCGRDDFRNTLTANGVSRDRGYRNELCDVACITDCLMSVCNVYVQATTSVFSLTYQKETHLDVKLLGNDKQKAICVC
jgi:hypothetical protein